MAMNVEKVIAVLTKYADGPDDPDLKALINIFTQYASGELTPDDIRRDAGRLTLFMGRAMAASGESARPNESSDKDGDILAVAFRDLQRIQNGSSGRSIGDPPAQGGGIGQVPAARLAGPPPVILSFVPVSGEQAPWLGFDQDGALPLPEYLVKVIEIFDRLFPPPQTGRHGSLRENILSFITGSEPITSDSVSSTRILYEMVKSQIPADSRPVFDNMIVRLDDAAKVLKMFGDEDRNLFGSPDHRVVERVELDIAISPQEPPHEERIEVSSDFLKMIVRAKEILTGLTSLDGQVVVHEYIMPLIESFEKGRISRVQVRYNINFLRILGGEELLCKVGISAEDAKFIVNDLFGGMMRVVAAAEGGDKGEKDKGDKGKGGTGSGTGGFGGGEVEFITGRVSDEIITTSTISAETFIPAVTTSSAVLPAMPFVPAFPMIPVKSVGGMR